MPEYTTGRGDRTERAPRSDYERDTDAIRAELGDLKDSARATVRERAEQEFKARRDDARDQIDETADALDQSAARFRAEDQASLAHLAEHGAEILTRLSSSIRDKSLDELGQDLQREARRHPAFFIAGAVGLGFAASRFLRASRSHAQFDDDADDADEAIHGDARDYSTRSVPSTPGATVPGATTVTDAQTDERTRTPL
jgi:hypothetical protein